MFEAFNLIHVLSNSSALSVYRTVQGRRATIQVSNALCLESWTSEYRQTTTISKIESTMFLNITDCCVGSDCAGHGRLQLTIHVNTRPVCVDLILIVMALICVTYELTGEGER